MSYINKESVERLISDTRRALKPQDYHTEREFFLLDNALLNLEQMVHMMSSFDWVSVNERLPEEGQETLVLVEGIIETDTFEGNRGQLIKDDDGFLFEASGWYINSCLNVTHWMPIPKPNNA